MKWQKKGLIFKPDNHYPWMVSHAQVAIADEVRQGKLRIYFGTRDKENRTITTFIEVNPENPAEVLYVHNKPVLDLGPLGAFDDCGAMPACIVNKDGKKYLYYSGWNLAGTVPYRIAIGVAVSEDDGLTFQRIFEGPIMDRTHSEPYWCAAPFVMVEDNTWKIWYLSCFKWQVQEGKPEPYYHVKYAESQDGINWDRRGTVCIETKTQDEAAIARPVVIKEPGLYKMFYAFRGARGYRSDVSQSYRIGYAESPDGIQWTRKDDRVGIDISGEGWDSMMVAYPNLYRYNGKTYMLYNGNGFGKSGLGYAVLIDE